MNAKIALLLVVAFMAFTLQGAEPKKKDKSWFTKIVESLAPPKKKPVKAKPRRRRAVKKRSTPIPTPSPAPKPDAPQRSPDGAYIVDAQWMANYWLLELAWGFPMPEDDETKFVDGKYHVRPVVYRHYEDMLNTPPKEQ